MALLNNQFAPITSSMGLIKASLQETSTFFAKWTRGILNKYGQDLTETPLDCELSEAINRLAPLSSGIPTRYLLLALGDGWTAFFDNSRRGTDPAGVVAVISSELRTTTLRLSLKPNTIRSADPTSKPGTYGAAIFEAFEGNQRSRRSIACVNDGGHWVFEQHGEPYEFEDVASYQNRVVAKRFGPELLKKYVQVIAGTDPFSDAAYVDQQGHVRGVLLEKVGNLPVTLTYVSLVEARKALGLR